MEMEKSNSNFLKSQWFLWIMLLFIPIVGIVLLWKYQFYHVIVRIFLTILFGLLFIFMIFLYLPDPSPSTIPSTPSVETTPPKKQNPPPNLEKNLSGILQDLEKYIINNFSNESWVQDFSRFEVMLYPTGSSIVKLYSTLNQKNGNEQKIADGVGTYFTPSVMSKYQLTKVKLMVFNKNGESIYEKIIENK